MGIFDIMGPIMIGPSSSHTAGATKIGYYAYRIYDREFKEVEIHLYNSFADTGKGHGTDKAIVAGLLGIRPDDEKIINSFSIAEERGIKLKFFYHHDTDLHSNLVRILFPGLERFQITGISTGGGKVKIIEINGSKIEFEGKHETLILIHKDVPGIFGHFSTVLGNENINIAYLHAVRDAETEKAISLLKLDAHCPDDVITKIYENSNIIKVTRIEKIKFD
jgi:L-serine dehydratase